MRDAITLDGSSDDSSAVVWPRGLGLMAAAVVWLLALVGLGSADVLAWAAGHGLPLAFIVASAAALCVVPGLALLRLLWPDAALAWPERLAVAWGVGAALPPLLLSLAHVAGLPWGRWATSAYLLLALALLILLAARRAAPASGQRGRAAVERVTPRHGFLFLGLLLLALLARLYTSRDLLAGANVDNHHHTLIVQLLVDHGGLFTSWEPYAPLATFTYHYGFHANVAFFHWLTGIPVTLSLL